jgi:mannitol-1-phosphate 5-dehydrogenase
VARYKAVIVGAGALGLGFIAERLADHYDLWLADISPNQHTLRRIEAEQSFIVNVCSLDGIWPQRVTGRFEVTLADTPQGRAELNQALREADLVLTATGRQLLDGVIASIATALNARTRKIWLLFCENGQHIAESYARSFGPQTVLVDTVMSRMCRFDQQREDRYQPVWSESDRALVVEDYRFLPLDADLCQSGPFASVFSLVPRADFLLWADIKHYLHNGMHAFVSYHAFLEGVERFAETPSWIRREAQKVMLEEIAPALVYRHACARKKEIEGYALSLLKRFFNPFFDDTIERGVRGVADKLAPDERLLAGCEYIRGAGIEPRGYASTVQAAREILTRQGG